MAECEAYFRSKGMTVSRYELAHAYMVFGGIPHYLSLFEKGYSTAQNIDMLLFEKDAKLKNEFDRLLGSLFKNEDDHKKVIRLLAQRRKGFTRKEILERTGIKEIEDGASHLLELKRLIREYNKKEKQMPLREPDLLIVITGGKMAYTRPDGVKVIPLACIKE